MLNEGTLNGTSVFALNAITALESEVWKEAYMKSDWFGDIYRFLKFGTSPASKATLHKALDHRIDEVGILWVHRPQSQIYLSCIPESKVLSVLIEIHDHGGHWAKTDTLAKLRELVYWP